MASPVLDPRIRRVLDEVPPGLPEHLGVPDQRVYLRALSDLLFLRHSLPGPRAVRIEDHVVPAGYAEIRLRIYRPHPESRLPVHVTLHGGGWKIGSIDELVNDAVCRTRCVEAECAVVAVEYRLAPEHRFPVPLMDCYAALVWVVDHADLLNVDPHNVSIGGVSAGANLAAAATLHARTLGGPPLRFQLLEVPALDLTRRTAQETLDSGAIPLDAPQPTMTDAIQVYLGDRVQGRDMLASPLFAPDLTGLPPAFVMTAEFDMLRTEGEHYARRLHDAGVPVTHQRYAGALHGTSTWTRSWPPALVWQRDANDALRRAHHGTPAEPRAGISSRSR